ncbi:MAG: glycerol-3-phosphate 1-O-acyltransferase PlsY [Bacteroidetes bacterium]|nr:glycerol-3-phosphate 1-O-acyltransferase PlsY [Bacteroidota bacterium]
MYFYPAIELILAYMIGSIPSAVIVGKIFYGKDVRDFGSGNAGATNVIRVLGMKAGIPVFIFDIFKGWFAVQLATMFSDQGLSSDMISYLKIGLAIAVVLGHIFPVYVGFRGGKGVATLAGVGIALYPVALLIVLVIFILVILISGYVSLSSILASVAFPFIIFFLLGEREPGLVVLAIFVAVFIPLSHRKNIKRLLQGTENKFTFKKRRQSNKVIK